MKKQKKSIAADRKIIFVDLENVCAHPVLNEQMVVNARNEIEEKVGIGPRDLVVIGTTHTNNQLAAGFGWRGARNVFMPDKNGAERALEASLDDYDMSTFAEAVIVSGDHYFLCAVNKLKALMKLTVVARADQMSRKLSDAAPNVIAL